jgi:hypothetical protein
LLRVNNKIDVARGEIERSRSSSIEGSERGGKRKRKVFFLGGEGGVDVLKRIEILVRGGGGSGSY